MCDPYAADPVLWAMHESVKLLLVLSQADAAVKAYVCEGANPRHLLHCVNHLQQPCLVKVRSSHGNHASLKSRSSPALSVKVTSRSRLRSRSE